MISYKRYFNSDFINSKNNKSQNFFGLDNMNYFWANSIRTGLLEVFDQLKITSQDTILLPAFSPHGIVLPIKKKRINIIYYKLNKQLSPDWDYIENKISETKFVKAIFLIHYFGYEQNFCDKIITLREKGITVIEDCAHSFKNDFLVKDNGIGSMGDVTIFSLTKFFPIPDGSLFVINNNEIVIKKIKYKFSFLNYTSVFCNYLQLFFKTKTVLIKFAFFKKTYNILSILFYAIYYWTLCKQNNISKISKVSLNIINTLNIEGIIKKRKANAKYLYENLKPNKWEFVLPYQENNVLTGIPIICDFKNDFVNKLKEKNIQLQSYNKYWWFVPPKLKKQFIFEKEFHDKHFLLPVSENISMEDLKYFVNVINNL